MKRHALLLTAALGMAAAQTSAQTNPITPGPVSPNTIPARPLLPVSSSTVLVSASSAPVDPQLSGRAVSVNTGSFRGPLSVLLVSVAKAAGYEVVFDMNVDALPLALGTPVAGTPVAAAPSGVAGTALSYDSNVTAKPLAYNLVNRPFNQVWPLLMDVYGLSYTIVQVGPGQILRVGNSPVQRNLKLPTGLRATDIEPRLKVFFGSRKMVPVTAQVNGATVTTQELSTEITLDSPTLRIVAEPSSNSILVRGTSSEVLEVERLFREIVSAQTPGQNVPVVQRIYTSRTSAGGLRLTLLDQFPTLRVAAVAGTEQLILSGIQPQIDAALALLAQIDVPARQAEGQTVQRIYTARGAAADLIGVLTAQYPGLKVTPVGQTGQLVLSGPRTQLDAALELLAQIDRPAPAATASAPALPPARSIYTVKGQQADISAVLGAQYPDLKVTPVGQTGQLVLVGPQAQLDAALALLGQVDRAAPTPGATVQRVFQLVNASAEEMRIVLLGQAEQARTTVTTRNETGSTATDTAGQAGTAASTTATQGQNETVTKNILAPAQEGLLSSNPPTIIADKRTNTLIVRGSPAQVDQIADLIPRLDQVVPQINVQVRIQEISETAARTLGMDWKVGFGGFNVSLGGGGLGASFDPTRSLVGFNIFPTLQALETQGLTKRVYDGNITMQSGQRSLGTTTATQNASSTASASIKSGGRLEINIPSQAANVAAIQKQIDYGLNLDFFDPQVAPDGTVTLPVRGQANNLAGELPTNALPNLLNFTNSEAQSTITFKSGQTVLMSGLLGTTESRTNGGVPFLSSLPVIGPAFGKQTTNRTQTQLLVIITGSVVK